MHMNTVAIQLLHSWMSKGRGDCKSVRIMGISTVVTVVGTVVDGKGQHHGSKYKWF